MATTYRSELSSNRKMTTTMISVCIDILNLALCLDVKPSKVFLVQRVLHQLGRQECSGDPRAEIPRQASFVQLDALPRS